MTSRVKYGIGDSRGDTHQARLSHAFHAKGVDDRIAFFNKDLFQEVSLLTRFETQLVGIVAMAPAIGTGVSIAGRSISPLPVRHGVRYSRKSGEHCSAFELPRQSRS